MTMFLKKPMLSIVVSLDRLRRVRHPRSIRGSSSPTIQLATW